MATSFNGARKMGAKIPGRTAFRGSRALGTGAPGKTTMHGSKSGYGRGTGAVSNQKRQPGQLPNSQ
jgi:hypothetical protein